jgi:hypothetical protein
LYFEARTEFLKIINFFKLYSHINQLWNVIYIFNFPGRAIFPSIVRESRDIFRPRNNRWSQQLRQDKKANFEVCFDTMIDYIWGVFGFKIDKFRLRFRTQEVKSNTATLALNNKRYARFQRDFGNIWMDLWSCWFLCLDTTGFELLHTVSKMAIRHICLGKKRTKLSYFKDFYVINNRIVYIRCLQY